MKSTNIRIFVDFNVSTGPANENNKIDENTYFCRFHRSPFQKRNCSYKNFNFQKPARALCEMVTCGRRPGRCARGVHAVCMRCACGVHVVCMGCAWGVHGVCIVYVRCMNVCMHVVCVWYACNTHVVCTWCGRGLNAVRTWYARGMRVVYTWYTRAFHVVCMWYARGVHVVCMRYARDMHVVCTWYARGLHVVCTWYACGMHALHTYLENSLTHLRKTCTGLGKTAVSRPPNECDNLMATVAFGDVVPADVQKWPSRRGPAQVFENRNFCMSSSVFESEIFEIDKNTYFCRF